MKSLTKPSVLTAICFAAGVICICTQQWLFTDLDEKGLLALGHPGRVVAILVLCICAVLLLLGKLPHKEEYRFESNGLSAIGALISVVGCLSGTELLFREPQRILCIIGGAFGVVSALCGVVIALDCWKNRKTNPLFYCPITLFVTFYAASRYQLWGEETELLWILFPSLGAMGLMLSTYYRAAFQEKGKGGKKYLLLSRATMLCCLAAIPGNEFSLMYGAMVLYILLDGLTVQPVEE